MLKREEDKWVLYTRDGSRILGRHNSYNKAKAQERAIQYNKLRKK